ncbi:lysophospholipase [Zavarzinia compransoris]|uniref:alpha/beta fold hydrolase n=1 Tax=Zavarzinia marina TaxID=2911065 RepID=UPI001F41378E|nr:alpha/beta fold hydrolase [Zavarzinia marina]MCF4166398.1 lysophospholipase [Zavarzinia marina]
MSRLPFAALAPLLIALGVTGCGATVTGLGAPVTVPALADGAFRAADGTGLALRAWAPPDGVSVEAVAVALHGFNDYAEAFAPAAPFWATRGIVTYAYDQRGFGHSATRPLWPGEEALVADAAAMVRLARARHPGKPVFLIGESMGAAVALLTLARRPDLAVDGLVLLAPAVWKRSDVPFPGTLLLDVAAFAMPWNTLSAPPGLGIRATDNREAAEAMRDDPLIGKDSRFDTLQGLVALMQAAAEAGVPDGPPVLLLYGMKDRIVPVETLRHFVAEARNATGFRQVWYGQGYHLLLRDRHATRVWRDIAAFVTDPDGRLPSDDLNMP